MKTVASNRRAYFEYSILEKTTAGIQLKGSEVKAIRDGNVNMTEAYCLIDNGEIFIKNMHISEHKHGGIHNNHEPLRDRKLLLRKKEILNLSEKVKQKGLTIVALAVLLSDTGLIKVEIGLAKGKKIFDKSKAIKLRDLDRELRQNR